MIMFQRFALCFVCWVFVCVLTSAATFQCCFPALAGISKLETHIRRSVPSANTIRIHSRTYSNQNSISSHGICTRIFQWSSPQTLHGWKLNGDGNDDHETQRLIEETRIKVLQSRRQQIRQTLQSAEKLRNFRWNNGYVPEIDPNTGKPEQQDGKVAVSLTAFVVAVGVIVLRIGGRAALISAVGLDFLSDSPELKDNLELVIQTADTMDPITKGLLFTAGWTAVKVLCFDAGGVILALASGILFGGVIPGALASATAATIGSTVAFTMAKLDTPIRTKALSLLDEYPSLRGIERVVARDGVKAVLTLRLAPVLPIPIGMYSYIYGVTNVPLAEFMGGIFLGSLKPYLFDSYLGYFGKEIVQGMDVTDGGLQDYILLGALGISILIGVFASQLASETWDSVIQEVKAEQKAKSSAGIDDDITNEENDGIVRSFLGLSVPDWLIGFQLGIQAANERTSDMIATECNAKVWNYTTNIQTSTRDGIPILPPEMDPANFINSPERQQMNQGLDFGQDFCNGLVLSPLLFTAFAKYSDPFFDASNDQSIPLPHQMNNNTASDTTVPSVFAQGADNVPDQERQQEGLRYQLNALRSITEQRIVDLTEKLKERQ